MPITVDKNLVRLAGKILLGVIPVAAAMWSTVTWVDTRYMHKAISDSRFVELQMRIVDDSIGDYAKLISSGQTPTEEEKIQHEMDKEQMKHLTRERNRIMGIGDYDE